jgi:hypothetical protein
LKLRHGLLEIGQPGLRRFIENRKCAGNPQTSANRFLASRLLIDKDQIGMHLGRERNGFTLSEIESRPKEVAVGSKNFYPRRHIAGPILDRFRRQGVVKFRQYGRWNQNSCV